MASIAETILQLGYGYIRKACEEQETGTIEEGDDTTYWFADGSFIEQHRVRQWVFDPFEYNPFEDYYEWEAFDKEGNSLGKVE